MNGLGGWFFKTATVYAVAGMIMGAVMAGSGDHGQMVTHAHLMLIGWVSFALMGLYYDRYRTIAASLLARVHFWLSQIGLIAMTAGLFGIYGGRPQFDPLAAVGSIAVLASMILFAAVVLRGERAAAPASLAATTVE